MVVVWNNHGGDIFAFGSLDEYREFARANEGEDRTCWSDTVYDVGAGGQATPENQVDMTEFNLSLM